LTYIAQFTFTMKCERTNWDI